MEIWRHGDMETWRHGDTETWRHEVMKTWSHEDMETWRPGDMETWRHKVMETSNGKRKWKHRRFSLFYLPCAHCANGSLSFVRLLTKKQMEVIRLKTDLPIYEYLSSVAAWESAVAAIGRFLRR